MKYIFFVFFASLSLAKTFAHSAGSEWVDSLLNVLKTGKLNLNEQVVAYHLITEHYAPFDMNNTYYYGMKGLELAQRKNDKRMISVFYRYIASTYTYRTSYDTAHVYQQMQIDIAEELQDREFLQQAYFGMANLYARQGRFALAVENYLKSITYYNENDPYEPVPLSDLLADLNTPFPIHDIFRIYVLCLSNTGECYRRLNNLDMALYYQTKARDVLEAKEGRKCHPQIYRELGYIYYAQGDMDKALEYQLMVLYACGGLNQVAESDCKEALIKIYIARGEYDEALKHAHDCLKLAKSLGDPYIDVLAWNAFAEIYRAQGLFGECERAAWKAWEIDSTSIDTAPVSAFNMACANAFLGNKQKSERFFKKYEAFMAERTHRNYQEAMADLEVKYESEKKEMLISSLEKEKELYVWLGMAGIWVAATLAVVLRQKVKGARKERQLIATHAVLDGEMGERARLARDLHDRLSGSLSALKIELTGSLESARQVQGKIDGCIEEIRRAAHNLMPVSLQFGLKVALEDFTAQFPQVQFHFFGEERRIDERKEFVAYCCVNELVTNSLRHSGASTINVQLVINEEHVSLTVQDNGCGFDEKLATGGIGLKNIHDRVASCNGSIDIVTARGKGTETTIEFKTGRL